ncbi:MAG TPA: hypothetical protein VMF56_02600 [Acidobacteriaceae bacterium]|nr:hypothetical protein [Acidobacteriaceae bacterium]
MTMWTGQLGANRKAAMNELPVTWAEAARIPDAWPSSRNKTPTHLPLMNTCMNADCRTSWLRLWRRRNVPRFEGQWACSADCMRVLIENAVERELGDGTPLEPKKHKHRIPLGLLMLSQGWITQEQLRRALDSQREAGGKARIGKWLMQQCNLSEEQVTRALSMQWGCPVLSFSGHAPEAMSTLIPRLLLDTYGMVPLRNGSSRLAYLAFEDRVDSSVALAAERMNGIHVEPGVVTSSQFLRVQERMMRGPFPKTQLMEAKSSTVVAKELAAVIERMRPHQARLVRMHRYFWLRVWHNPMHPASSAHPDTHSVSLVPRIHQVEDVLVRLQPED